MTMGSMCGRGVQRIWQLAVCGGGDYRGYDSKKYVQRRNTEGMALDSLCRSGLQRV